MTRWIWILTAPFWCGCFPDDGDVLAYHELDRQPSLEGFGVLVEVLARPATSTQRELGLRVEAGALVLDGTRVDGDRLCLDVAMETERRVRVSIRPDDGEAILYVGLHEDVTGDDPVCDGTTIDSLVVPIQRVTDDTVEPDAGAPDASVPDGGDVDAGA